MVIESLQLYDHFGNHVPCNCPRREFISLHDVALFLRDWLLRDRLLYEAFAWIDNQRYMLVTRESYDIHYHGFFDQNNSNFKPSKF